MAKIIYNYDQEGYYIGSQEADINPLETKIKKQNIYLLPANATFTKMNLKVVENKKIKWDKTKWIYEDLEPIEAEPKPTDEEKIDQLKNEAISARRNYLYSTDWYILREYDQPNSYPDEVREKRIIARSQINEIEMITTLEKANLIEETYPFKI